MTAPLPQRQLSIDKLAAERGERMVFAGLTAGLAAGEALLLRGRNGAGKSTLLLCLAGIVRPSEGRIVWGGRQAEERPGEDLLFVGHLPAIKPSLTVRENLAFWAALNGDAPARIAPALAEIGLARLADIAAGQLSAGQTRRLSLARLLISDRPVWLLDEPTSALDSEGHALVARLIDAHLARGGMAVIATHDDIALTGPTRSLAMGAAR